MKRRNRFNRVKRNKLNSGEAYKRTFFLKRTKGESNPLIGFQHKLNHIEILLGYKVDRDGEYNDSWEAMSPQEIRRLEAERRRLIEILTPIRLGYNKKRFSKTFHTE